ncbi:MAG: catalase [Micromonosporaceae bacterium]|nr:catalase [Micromonosporaceae bacterium]
MKDQQLSSARVDLDDSILTTDQAIPVEDTDNSLRAGARGPTLLADFHLREKITRFDHERIPERVVHARGSGAYGWFQPYESLRRYTTAHFLTDPARRTPVFVRFSTVQGSRGSADTVRDVRGFATKFYTDQGNFDLVGNNMPVFFIQDGIKFPDFVHALKPEPQHEMPQGASAHDTFWDFVSLQPETMHHVIWLMSDRALPRSYRAMQGFGVHTFRLVNEEGEGTFVKFHWTPAAGVQSLVWDEAQKIAGKDPDFNRRDLWESIAAGVFPEYELGMQLIPESDEFAFDFDLLDPTKIVPEELVPVTPVGRMVLDRNPDNFFAETEQVAFCVGNIVPGIDFSDDPLMQARLFSYLDTQLTRLGGPNFAQLPVNRPVAPVRNHQQDGFGQQQIPTTPANYHPNSLADGCPRLLGGGVGGAGRGWVPGPTAAFLHYPERVKGVAHRRRSETFADHYSQPTLFWNSMSGWEKEHIIAAYRFELGKVDSREIRDRAVGQLAHIDLDLASAVAAGIGVAAPEKVADNHGRSSPALSQSNGRLTGSTGIAGRKVAFLVADGVEAPSVTVLRDALQERGVVGEVLGPVGGTVQCSEGDQLPVTRALPTVGSVLYDGVVVAGGSPACVAALASDGYAVHFVAEAYKHAKPIAALGSGTELLLAASLPNPNTAPGALDGVVTHEQPGPPAAALVEAFVAALAAHRHFGRPLELVPA